MFNMSHEMNKRGETLRPVEEKALDLYKKLLKVMELESTEIVKKNFDRSGHFWSQKLNILKELDELKTDEKWMGNPATHEELGKLIKKVIDMNEANAHAVRNIKSKINEELSSLHKSRSAYKAYNSKK